MYRKAWDIRGVQAEAVQQTAKAEVAALDRQIEQLVDRIFDTASAKAISASRLDARPSRPLDQRVGERPLLPHVELEPQLAARRRGDLLHGGDRAGGDAEGDAGLRRRAGERRLAVVPDEPRRGRRRHHQRQRPPPAEQIDAEVARRDVGEDARVERRLVEGAA